MFKVQTEAFKYLVARSAKGASCDKVLPLTGLMSINLTDGILCLSTTDAQNTLELYQEDVTGKNMEAVVGVELFSKLIAKQTSPDISIDLKKGYLLVKGNGEYKVPLIMDEEGMAKFPEFSFDKEAAGKPEILHLTSVNNIISVNRASLCNNADKPQLRTYYCHAPSDDLHGCVITTNEEAMCFNGFAPFKESVAITPSMMELLALNTTEKIEYYRKDGFILAEAPDMVLYGPEYELFDEFPIDTAVALYELQFPSSCDVAKTALQDVLDRLALFIEAFDKNSANMIFTKAGLQIKSRQNSSDELLKYAKSENFQAMQVIVDVSLLKSQVDSMPGDTITISYGLENAIALASGNIVKVVALLAEDESDQDMQYAAADAEMAAASEEE